MDNELDNQEELIEDNPVVQENLNRNQIETIADDEVVDLDFSAQPAGTGEQTQGIGGLVEGAQTRILDAIDNTLLGDQQTREEITDTRAADRAAFQARSDVIRDTPTFASEAVRAALGYKEDAIRDALLLVDKTGDEVKKQINKKLGRPVDPRQDPSSDSYDSWFDGDHRIVAENQTGLGQFSRSILQFFQLTRWTGNVLPKSVGWGATVHKGQQMIRVANPVTKSSKAWNVFTKGLEWSATKGLQITTEGAAAGFIMSTSEGENLANMAQEHAPWLLPSIMDVLAHDPETDPWYVERLKSELIGSAFNHIGYVVGATSRGLWKGSKYLKEIDKAAKKNGTKLTDEAIQLAKEKANKIAKETFEKDILESTVKAQNNGDAVAKMRYDYGKGINPENAKTEYILRHIDLDEDRLEYSRLLDGNEPSESFIQNLKKRGKAEIPDDEDELWRDIFNNLEDDDFLDVKGIMNMPERPSLRELAMDDYFRFAKAQGARRGDPWLDNQGMSLVQASENALRETDELVNADISAEFEKISYEGGFVKWDPKKAKSVDVKTLHNALRERQWNWRENHSTDNVIQSLSEPFTSQVAFGSKDLYQIYKEVADEMNALKMDISPNDWNVETEATIEYARPFLEMIDAFVGGKKIDLVDEYRKIVSSGRKNKVLDSIEYKYPKGEDGKQAKAITTGVHARDANMFVLHSLGKTVYALAQGSMKVQNDLPLIRNYEMFTDLMKVIFIENKKFGYHWGITGRGAQQGWIGKMKEMFGGVPAKKSTEIYEEAQVFFKELDELKESGDVEAYADLMHMALMTGGQVRSLAQIPEYLGKRLTGGRMKSFNGEYTKIEGQIWKEAYQTVINSWLGAPRTFIKSIFMTNALNATRGLEQLTGAHLPWKRFLFNPEDLKGSVYEGMDFAEFTKAKSKLIGIQYAAMRRSQQEAWHMFWRNFDINMRQKIFADNGDVILRRPDYRSRYDESADMKLWEQQSRYYEKYGSDYQKYIRVLPDSLYKINKLWLSKLSRSAMNAGDAYTRTIIGRQQMALNAAEGALKAGVDIDDLDGFAKTYEQLWRKEIFRKNKDGAWVVKDPRSKAIGDKVTLMEELPEAFRFAKELENNVVTQRFFAFSRPAILGYGHFLERTPFKVFTEQYQDLVRKAPSEDLAKKWGLTLDELPRAKDEIQGKIALGGVVSGLLWSYAMNGQLIGDYPKDEADRRMWKSLKIQPNSFAIPKPWNPVTQDAGDNGWVYVGFGRSDIFSTLASTIGNLVYYQGVMGDDVFNEWQAKLQWIFATAVSDLGVIQSTQDLVTLMDGTMDKGQNFERAAAKLFRPQIGFGGQSRFLREVFDATEKEANTFLEFARQQDFLFRMNIPNDYDILGKERGVGNVKPLRNGPHNPVLRLLNALSPVTITSNTGDPVKQALHSIRYDIGAETSTLSGVPLNSQEKSDFKLVLAEDRLFRKELEEKVNEKEWQDMIKYYNGELPFSPGKKRERSGPDKALQGYQLKREVFYTEIQEIFADAKKRAVLVLRDKERFPEYNANDPDALFMRIQTGIGQKGTQQIRNLEVRADQEKQLNKVNEIIQYANPQ